MADEKLHSAVVLETGESAYALAIVA